ncbi:MAG: hypothetical protein ACO3SO_04995 [Luteolibacter sp.]
MRQTAFVFIAAMAALSPAVLHVEKTLWVMFRYGDTMYMALGMVFSSLIAFLASRQMRRGSYVALLVAAALPLWIAMFRAADSGYRKWQGSANAPADACADTGPIFFLIAGWLPSLGMVYLLQLLFQRIFPRPPA